MNKVFLMGRLTRDPELRQTANQISVASFTIAVDRKFKDASGQHQADFINCVAWRGTAEFVAKYFKKGGKIIITGSLQSRSWDDNDGKRHSVIEVVAEEAEFAESKRDDQAAQAAPPAPVDGAAVFQGDPEALPFDI